MVAFHSLFGQGGHGLWRHCGRLVSRGLGLGRWFVPGSDRAVGTTGTVYWRSCDARGARGSTAVALSMALYFWLSVAISPAVSAVVAHGARVVVPSK